MNRWFILAVLLLLNERPQSAAAAAQQQVLAKPAAVQSSLTDAESEAVDIAVLAELEKQEVVGAAVGILYEGEIVYVRGYGLADRKRRTPVTTATEAATRPIAAAGTIAVYVLRSRSSSLLGGSFSLRRL